MPFDRDGQWRNPASEDIEGFKQALETALEDGATSIVPTKELVQAIESSAPPSPNMTTADFFQTVSRLQGSVDIVIPVYGGIHVLKECVRTIKERTSMNYRLIFVDDCSPDPEVDKYLTELVSTYEEPNSELMTVVRNRKNRGFAATVNRGVAEGSNPYVCILNSDVMVTENWLTKMCMAMESNPKNVMVNPVTNNTAMVNVGMYPGMSYLDMNRALEKQAIVRYPEVMPTGFCMMVRRAIWEEIGPFDEAFGSYGEESDWWFRTIKATNEDGYQKGYRAVMADNCYLFHERGTSFSQLGEMAHVKQRQAGGQRFHALHPDYKEWAKGHDSDGIIDPLRTGIPRRAFDYKYKGNIAWVVKSTGPCGGMYYIADLANWLIEDGYSVKICMVPDDPEAESHAMIGNLHTQPIKFESKQDFVNRFSDEVFNEGILFSAVTELGPAARSVAADNDKIKVFNHVQSWDPDLAVAVGRNDIVPMILEEYSKSPNISVSDWVTEKLKRNGAEVISTIFPGVNRTLFHERDRRLAGDERKTFAVLLQPGYQFKGYDRGVQVCEELLRNAQEEIRVVAIGVGHVPEVPGVLALGGLSQAKMAEVLGTEVDVLIDPSTSHSYGLPGLEALASGAHYVCWDNKGCMEYSTGTLAQQVHILDPSAEPKDVALRALGLDINPDSFRQSPTFSDLAIHDRNVSIDRFVEEVIECGAVEEIEDPMKIRVVSPHMRKHGGPTTLISLANLLSEAGHDVDMSMIYTDWNPEVLAGAHTEVSNDWDKHNDDKDVLIINSDNPFAEQIMQQSPQAKHVMYKLSHNPRFQEVENNNLNLPWHHIMTSTPWLTQACMFPMEGWTHKAWVERDVSVVGWYHYGHPVFNLSPAERLYGDAESGFRVGTLIHGHELKGSQDAIFILDAFKRKYEAKFHAVGVGELRATLPGYMQYFKNETRPGMAKVFKQLDIWLGASRSDGLGRMALENMSAGTAVVTTDTGAPYLKDGENCLLYPVGERGSAIEAIDRLINDRELFAKLVVNGYETAAESANWREFQTNVLTVLEKVMQGETNE